jgi:hypothetical protein
MQRRTGISILFLVALAISSCEPKAGPGQMAGVPNPVYYGACSPTSVKFSYEWHDTPPAGGLAPPPRLPFVFVNYQLLGPGGAEVASGAVGLTHSVAVPIDAPMELPATVDRYSGALDMNPFAPLLKGGAGSLVFYAQEMFPPADKESGGDPSFYFTGRTSDSKVVSVLPCAPTPTPTVTATQTPTETSIPPTRKPKPEEPEEPPAEPPPCGPNDPNCQP